jgi:phospholipase C
VDRTKRAVELRFRNTGKAAAVFHVRADDGKRGPWSYTVGPQGELSDSFPVVATGGVDYSFSVYGPNGFFRSFGGSIAGSGTIEVDVIDTVTHSGDGVASAGVMLKMRNTSADAQEIKIRDGYTLKTETLTMAAGAAEEKSYPLDASFGWYDLMVEVDEDVHFRRHVAGHVETGRDSVTDPAMGKA